MMYIAEGLQNNRAFVLLIGNVGVFTLLK